MGVTDGRQPWVHQPTLADGRFKSCAPTTHRAYGISVVTRARADMKEPNVMVATVRMLGGNGKAQGVA